MESTSSGEKLKFVNSTQPPRKNTEEGGAAGDTPVKTNHKRAHAKEYLHLEKWSISVMAILEWMNSERPKSHLLQEAQTGAGPPSSLCSSSLVGGLNVWVGSFNFFSP